MHAIILAAGRGERLRPLTDTTNKVLIEVDGRPLIDHMIETIVAAGVGAITIVTGHCAELVERHVGSQYGDVPIDYAFCADFASTNNIVSLATGLAALPAGTALLLIEGDLLLDPALIGRIISAPAPDAALVEQYRAGLDGTLARIDEGQIAELIMGPRLTDVANRPSLFKTVNVTKFCAATLDEKIRPALGAWIERGGTGDYYEAVFAALLASGTLDMKAVVVGDERWAEIDDAADLDRARFLFAREGRRAVLDRSFGGYWGLPVLDYAYPRNIYFPTPAVQAELEALLPALIGRYGSAQSVLDQKLARYLHCQSDEVVLLNGLSQIYPWLSAEFGARKALIPQPCFGEYMRVWPHAANYRDDGRADPDRLRTAASDASIIVVVNPNNPTGTAFSSDTIKFLALERPDRMVIVDESFADFSERPSLLDICEGKLPPNILLLKSLGKALGAAGLRLGYVRSSNPEILARIRAALPVWNCNSLAEAFLEILPKHRRAIAESLALTRADRQTMIAELAKLPMIAEVWPSEANFLLVRLDLPEQQLGQLLDRLLDVHGIYVKDVSQRMAPSGAWVRLAVRSADDNHRFYTALKQLLARPLHAAQAS